MASMALRGLNMPIIIPTQKDRKAKKRRARAMETLEAALDQDSRNKGMRCRILTTEGTRRHTIACMSI
jgi:hypothetical protein